MKNVRLGIDAASINADNAKRNKDLRSADVFHVAKHPEIVFASHRALERDGKVVVDGVKSMIAGFFKRCAPCREMCGFWSSNLTV